jgi:hypothetical protein
MGKLDEALCGVGSGPLILPSNLGRVLPGPNFNGDTKARCFTTYDIFFGCRRMSLDHLSVINDRQILGKGKLHED